MQRKKSSTLHTTRRLFASIVLAAVVTGASPHPSELLAPATSSKVAVQLTGPSQPARVGIPFAVQAEITPRAGIHVYAPGNRDYMPVALTLEWPKGVRIKEPVYPPGEPFIFGSLKEVVTTYQRPFKITQQATILAGTAAARGRSIDVSGVVKYQACDDRICFPVAAIPVRVSIAVDGTLRGRGK